MSKLTIRSFAKLNLALDVLDKRLDGYHNIESVLQSISLHDCLTLTLRSDKTVSVRTSDMAVPSGPGNLAYRAAVVFLEAGGLETGVDIEIEKTVPMEAGLGGGSSNGAAALMALNELHGTPLAHEELMRLAAQVGSDAPFFLTGGTAFVSGRGEVVRELPDIAFDYIVVKPDFGVSTAWAYGELDAGPRAKRFASRAVAEAIERGDRAGALSNMANDFERVAEAAHPEIGAIRERLLSVGANGAMLAGSGSAVFGVFLDPGTCDTAYETVKTEYPRAYRAHSEFAREKQRM